MIKPKVLGKYVYVEVPIRKESKLTLDENTKESLQKEFLKQLSRVQVWAVGNMASQEIAEGDWVLVDPIALRDAKMVPFEDGVTRALILDYNVIHIWP